MSVYGVQVFNDAGVQVVGYDNPTVIIDNVARIQNVVAYDPPLVNGFTVTFHDALVKSYPQRDGVARLVCVGYYDQTEGQVNAAPYCMGWLVIEVG